jgi:uncharacterized protein (DUF1697 family)
MPAVIAMLRGVNLGGTRRLRMDDLGAVFASLKLRDVRTYIQSGNVVFNTTGGDLAALGRKLEKAIERRFGFHADVIQRRAAEMRDVVTRNPFAERRGLEPGRLIVTFLAADPGEKARAAVRTIPVAPEELYVNGRELYVYFAGGVGRSRLPAAAIERALGVSGTARNWNTVRKLLEIAETVGGAAPAPPRPAG